MFRNGLDTNGDLARAKIDRNDALGFGQREERIGHQILRIAGCEIAGKCTKQIELLAL